MKLLDLYFGSADPLLIDPSVVLVELRLGLGIGKAFQWTKSLLPITLDRVADTERLCHMTLDRVAIRQVLSNVIGEIADTYKVPPPSREIGEGSVAYDTY